MHGPHWHSWIIWAGICQFLTDALCPHSMPYDHLTGSSQIPEVILLQALRWLQLASHADVAAAHRLTSELRRRRPSWLTTPRTCSKFSLCTCGVLDSVHCRPSVF